MHVLDVARRGGREAIRYVSRIRNDEEVLR